MCSDFEANKTVVIPLGLMPKLSLPSLLLNLQRFFCWRRLWSWYPWANVNSKAFLNFLHGTLKYELCASCRAKWKLFSSFYSWFASVAIKKSDFKPTLTLHLKPRVSPPYMFKLIILELWALSTRHHFKLVETGKSSFESIDMYMIFLRWISIIWSRCT